MTRVPAQRVATRGTDIPHSGEVARDDPFPRVQGYCAFCNDVWHEAVARD